MTNNRFEEQLRESAPFPPLDLKRRTLANCAQRVAAQRARERRIQRQLSLAVLGVVMLQSLAIRFLDAQNAQIMAGGSTPPTFAAITMTQLATAVQERSREFARLVLSSNLG